MDLTKEGKKKVPHRSWTKAEEEVLIAAVKGIVAKGWKSDNGFKAGTYRDLEAAMKKAFPGTDIKGKPHIDLKLTGWKRTYSKLRDILNTSGVGFNLKGNNEIDCDNDQWEGICSTESKLKKWRDKSWDYYEDWQIMFGKDRATGEGASMIMEMVNELIQDTEGGNTAHQTADNTYMGDTEDAPNHSVADESQSQTAAGTYKTSKNKRKRQFEDSISTLVDLVGEMQQTNVRKYESFEEKFAKRTEVKETRGELWGILQNMCGLSLDEAFDVGEILMEKPGRMELFLGLTEEARVPYIDRILRKGT